MIYLNTLTVLSCYLLTSEARVAGPANIIFRYMQRCDNITDDSFRFIVEQKKYNRTVNTWKITLYTKYTVDDSLTVDVNIAMKGNGGYRRVVYYARKPVCEGLRNQTGDIYTTFFKEAIGADDCPIPPGTYSINNFHFENKLLKNPQVYGEYEMTSRIFKGEERLNCLKTYYKLVPKEN